jgi:hypothetical protein
MNRRTVIAALCIVECAVFASIIRSIALIDWQTVMVVASLALPIRRG